MKNASNELLESDLALALRDLDTNYLEGASTHLLKVLHNAPAGSSLRKGAESAALTLTKAFTGAGKPSKAAQIARTLLSITEDPTTQSQALADWEKSLCRMIGGNRSTGRDLEAAEQEIWRTLLPKEKPAILTPRAVGAALHLADTLIDEGYLTAAAQCARWALLNASPGTPQHYSARFVCEDIADQLSKKGKQTEAQALTSALDPLPV